MNLVHRLLPRFEGEGGLLAKPSHFTTQLHYIKGNFQGVR